MKLGLANKSNTETGVLIVCVKWQLRRTVSHMTKWVDWTKTQDRKLYLNDLEKMPPINLQHNATDQTCLIKFMYSSFILIHNIVNKRMRSGLDNNGNNNKNINVT